MLSYEPNPPFDSSYQFGIDFEQHLLLSNGLKALKDIDIDYNINSI